jgi:hypothetical protein
MQYYFFCSIIKDDVHLVTPNVDQLGSTSCGTNHSLVVIVKNQIQGSCYLWSDRPLYVRCCLLVKVTLLQGVDPLHILDSTRETLGESDLSVGLAWRYHLHGGKITYV